MPEIRRNISWPEADADLWADIQEAADTQSDAEHRNVSVSEWLRRAARERLEREKRRKAG